ncbi:MAG: aquaporin [Thermoplasmata archaeon]|nr:aquaporin [Thermoplasmata archaeon]
MAWTAGQKYLAEFLGTFALLLFGGGAAVTSLGGGFIVDPLSRVILVSLAFGIAIIGAAYALGEISGGHFNPAVTLSMALNRRMPWKDVIPYIVAQLIGALVGIGVVAGVAHGFMPEWTASVNAAFGSQCYSGNNAPCNFSMGSVFLLEVALTFVFVLVIQLITRSENGAKNLAPVGIGLTLAVTNLVAIPIDGASINPVRSFAPALLTLASGSGAPTWAIDQSWLFWVAPILGGLLAAVVESYLRPSTPEPASDRS